MSLRQFIKCEEELVSYEIGIYNHIKVLNIPVGVEVFISFKNTPNNQEIYPLSDEIKDLDKNGNFRKDVRRAFITTKGANFGEIELICSQVLTDNSFVEVIPKREIRLSDEVSQAILLGNFISNGRASQHTILPDSNIEIKINGLEAFKFFCTDTLGMELNKNNIKFPINGSDTIFSRGTLENIRFHNNTTSSITLSILYMGNIDIFNLLYVDESYVELDYLEE